SDTQAIAQRRAEPVDVFEQPVVRDALVAALDGHVAATPFDHVAIDEIRRRVELLGDAEIGRGEGAHVRAGASSAWISAGNARGVMCWALPHARRSDPSQISRPVPRSGMSNANATRGSVSSPMPTPTLSSSPSLAGDRNRDWREVRGMK